MTKKAADLVNVNTATLDELSAVPGLGPALAMRIMDARPYASLEDLTSVNGIGPRSLAPLLPYLTVKVSGKEMPETEPAAAPEPKVIIPKKAEAVHQSPLTASFSISTLLPVFVVLGIATAVILIIRALTTEKETAD